MRNLIFTLTILLTLVHESWAQTKRPSRDEFVNGSKNVKGILDDPFIFKRGELQATGSDRKAFLDAIAKSDAVIKEYGEEVTKFLATNPSPTILKDYLNRTLIKAKGADAEINRVANEYKTSNSMGSVYYLQNLYLYKGFLEGVTRIYTESQQLKDNLASVNSAISLYKSREDFMDKMVGNQKEQAKNMKMIPAGQSDPQIEAMVKKEYEKSMPGNTVTKVNITYNTWIVEKNELDIPICRKVSVCVAVKNSKGECGIGSANVREDYMGGGNYGKAYMYLPSDPIVVPCENIK